MQANIDKEDEVLSQMPVNDLTGLLKMFLRELPQGIMNSAYATFTSIPMLDGPIHTRALQLACGLLPREAVRVRIILSIFIMLYG